MFDYEKYSRAIDAFLIKMEETPNIIHAHTQEALEEICDLLRVAKVEIVYCNAQENAEDKKCERKRSIYESGLPVSETVYRQRSNVGSEGAGYLFYGIRGEESWNRTEYEKLHVLAKALNGFYEKLVAKQAASELKHRDMELGIYNLSYFTKVVNEKIAQHEIGKYGACYFNMRRFSVVNDQIGRKHGTLVMKRFVNELQSLLGRDDIVCRIGGDNFVVFFQKEKLEILQEYLASANIRYGEGRRDTIFVTTCAGYYMIPDDCKNAADVMDYASMALQAARKSVETSFVVFFDEELLNYNRKMRRIDNMFPNAIKEEEFKIFYQPKVDLKDYVLVGAEALCRWYVEEHIVPPGEFIPALENSQAICQLDFYMLERVCRDIRRWLDEGKKVVKVSVNLSRRHIRNERLLEDILDIIDRNNVPHEFIEIELTETSTDVDFGVLKELVSGLRENGISTSVDDFGTGYSSLKLLREIPWNVMKVDKSFLPEDNNPDNKKIAMLKHLIALSKDMGFDCIVEGVETLEQMQLVKRNNCYLAQGFYFDRPLPVQDFEKRLEAAMV